MKLYKIEYLNNFRLVSILVDSKSLCEVASLLEDNKKIEKFTVSGFGFTLAQSSWYGEFTKWVDKLYG